MNDINRTHAEVLEAYDEEGKPVETFDYGNERLNYYSHDNKDYAYQYDGRGSVASLTNDGEVADRYNYSAYGNTLQKGKIDNPYKYNAEYVDGATGMQFLRARYYDNSNTNSNTFITRDSYAGEADSPQSQNRCSYVKSNPVNFVAPTGHWPRWLNKAKKAVKKTARSVKKRAYKTAKRVVRGVITKYKTSRIGHTIR